MLNATEALAYLGIGSNMGERELNLEQAVLRLGKIPATRMLRQSSVYGSKPWGKVEQPDYLNMVVEIATRLPPQTLLRHCKHIESELGRTEGERWGPRPMDIDILVYGDRQLRTASLRVPHLHMWERHFVLKPLSELKPELRRDDGTTIEQLLQTPEFASQSVWLHEYARNGPDEKE